MDIVIAFAVLLRRIIFDEQDIDESWLRKLAEAGLSSDDIEPIYSVVSDRQWIDVAMSGGDGVAVAWAHVSRCFYNTVLMVLFVLGLGVWLVPPTPPPPPHADILFALSFSHVISSFLML